MARIFEPTKKALREWRKWVETRPDDVRVLAESFVPWELYRMKSTGHRVTIHGFSEGEEGKGATLIVHVLAEYNALSFERAVFGIEPEDLEPCELPGPNEVTGALFSRQEVNENHDIIRAAVRPDLWALDETGKARRKH